MKLIALFRSGIHAESPPIVNASHTSKHRNFPLISMRGPQNTMLFVSKRLPDSYRGREGERQAEKGHEAVYRPQTNVLLNSRVLSNNDNRPVWGTVRVEVQAETYQSQRELWQRKPPLAAPVAVKSVESLMTTRRVHNVLLLTILEILSRLGEHAREWFYSPPRLYAPTSMIVKVFAKVLLLFSKIADKMDTSSTLLAR